MNCDKGRDSDESFRSLGVKGADRERAGQHSEEEFLCLYLCVFRMQREYYSLKRKGVCTTRGLERALGTRGNGAGFTALDLITQGGCHQTEPA